MWERGSGVILQTASTNGIMGYPYYADYNATKAGVIELTRSMALELAPKVRVCAVAPGYVLTPMQRAEYTDEMLDEVESQNSLAPSRQAGRDCSLVRVSRVGRRGLCDRAGVHHGRRRDGRWPGEPIID